MSEDRFFYGDQVFDRSGGDVAGIVHSAPMKWYATKQSTTSTTYAPYEFWNNVLQNNVVSTSISSAYSNATSGRGDVVLVTPDSHSQGSGLTFSKNMTHVIGMYPSARFNHRARIGMSTTFSPMITVSGYGNLFANLYTMHGTASTDYIGWQITGNRNTFKNVHFGGPMNSDQGGHASYQGIVLSGSENYFKDCVIGTDTIGRDEASPNLYLSAGSGNNVFENCIFMCMLTDGDPLFVTVANTTTTTAHFYGCKFIALSSNWGTAMTKAFHFTGAATAGMFFDNNCQFYNVSAIAAADKDQFIWMPRAFASTTDTEGMIAVQLSI